MFKKNAEKPKPLAVQIKEAEQLAKLDAIERETRFKAELEERERDATREAWRAEQRTAKKTLDTAALRAVAERVIPFTPLVLVNLAAITGQVGWALAHLEIGEPGTWLRWVAGFLFGATAESIALFLQFYANRALRNRDSAASLYFATFVIAGLVASLNFSHWSNPDPGKFFGAPNATAVSFALCSFISPWLWRIKDRALHREILRDAGEIDARAVKLSLARKIMHPIKSFWVIWYASWDGETNPSKAIANYERRRAEGMIAKEAPVEPSTEDESAKYDTGVKLYRASLVNGPKPMTQRDLATALGMANRKLAAKIIKDVNNETEPNASVKIPANGGVPETG